MLLPFSEPFGGAPQRVQNQVQPPNCTWQKGPSLYGPSQSPANPGCHSSQTRLHMVPGLVGQSLYKLLSLLSFSPRSSFSFLKLQIQCLSFPHVLAGSSQPQAGLDVLLGESPVPVPHSQSSNSSCGRTARRSGLLAPISGEEGREQVTSPSDPAIAASQAPYCVCYRHCLI